MAIRRGAVSKTVVIYSLQYGALSALGRVGATPVDIAIAGDYRTTESSTPYLKQEKEQDSRRLQTSWEAKQIGVKRRVRLMCGDLEAEGVGTSGGTVLVE